MRNRLIGALVFLLVLVGVTSWRSVRARRSIPRPVQQVAAPVQKPPENISRDQDVEAVVRQGVTAFRKMLKDNPNGTVFICSNAKDCMAKVPGLNVPAGIRINLNVSNHGEVSGEAGRAGSGKSYYYYEGAAEVTVQNTEAQEWVIEPDSSRDDEIQAVLREAVTGYKKVVAAIPDKPEGYTDYCYNAKDCMAKVPGLKVPDGIKLNLGVSPNGEVSGEAGLAGVERSYQYVDGGSMKQTKHEAYESYLTN